MTKMSTDPATSDTESDDQELFNPGPQNDESYSSSEESERKLEPLLSVASRLLNSSPPASPNMLNTSEEIPENIEEVEKFKSDILQISEMFDIIQRRELYNDPDYKEYFESLNSFDKILKNFVFGMKDTLHTSQSEDSEE